MRKYEGKCIHRNVQRLPLLRTEPKRCVCVRYAHNTDVQTVHFCFLSVHNETNIAPYSSHRHRLCAVQNASLVGLLCTDICRSFTFTFIYIDVCVYLCSAHRGRLPFAYGDMYVMMISAEISHRRSAMMSRSRSFFSFRRHVSNF